MRDLRFEATMFSGMFAMLASTALALPNVIFVVACSTMLMAASFGYSRIAIQAKGSLKYLAWAFAISFWCGVPCVIQGISLDTMYGNPVALFMLLVSSAIATILVYVFWTAILRPTSSNTSAN